MKFIRKLFSKKVPMKNYVIVFVVSVFVIISCLYMRTLYLNYLESIKNTSVFRDNKIKIVNHEDLEFVIGEMSEVILYVGYTGDSEIYKIEKKLLKEIKKRNLIDKIAYWDATDKIKNDEYLKILKEKYPKISNQITVAPIFIYIKGGEAIEAMSSELKTIDINVFDKLVETYDIE